MIIITWDNTPSLRLRDTKGVGIQTHVHRVNAVTVQIPCYVVTSANTRFLSEHFNFHWSFCDWCWYCMQIKALDIWSCVLHKLLRILCTVEHLTIKWNNICNCKSYVHCFNGYFHVRAGLKITRILNTVFLTVISFQVWTIIKLFIVLALPFSPVINL